MDWDVVWKVVLAAVASVGGIGVVIAFLVKFASNIIAERMMQRYQNKLDKDIANYKHLLEVEIEKAKSQNEKVNYVSKRQFDTEFAAYEKIFDCMFKFSVCTRQLYPTFEWQISDDNERKEVFSKRLDDYQRAFNVFSETIEVNAPFIPEDLYDVFVKMRKLANEIAMDYKNIRIEERIDNRNEVSSKYPKEDELQEMVEDSKKRVREYLNSLRVYE